ncbi:MAG: carboxypeptidase-like regulatory domain-containing protein [Flavobacteriales bacterium]|nr:carboxypeptidase-like regulatory domain-containing protein [Flavobacteriales bacterium]
MRVLFLLILLSPIYLFGQYQIKGKVVDAKTKEALAFVNIIANNERIGTTTGIDGNFTFNSPNPIKTLTLSYVGYEQKEINLNEERSLLIEMKKTSFSLAEFKVLPGINPAERIIQEVINNRKKHNPEKSLNFKYESYSKMYFTALIDSAILNSPDKIMELDTNDQEAVKWLEDHHIFMMESVTERKYKQPDKSYEKVIASRVSGLKNATFSLIATEIQSFSFYNPTLNVLDKAYLNPITPNGINKYLFLIEDTAFSGADTVFIISFRPRKGKNFDALKGLLYVNTDEFALQNVIAEPMAQDEDIAIKIQQKYEKIEGSWFPVQLNSNLTFNNLELGNYKMMGIGKTYLKNIQINPEISNKEFSYIETEIDINATKKDEEFWNKHRGDTLSQKEKNTYHVIDSLGKAENFDKMVGGLEALLTGQIRWGPINLDLNRFIGYNEYEGFRLGAGLHTNKRVSKWFSIGGYGAYGFRDKDAKYGGDIDFLIHPRNDVSLNFSYQKDVAEPGVTQFYDFKIPLLSSAGNRLFYLSRMNKIEKVEARVKFRTFRYLKVYVFGNQETVEVTNDYYFKKRIDANTILRDQYYTFNEVGVEFRYAYKEKVIKTLNGKYPKKSNYPIIYAKIEQGLKQLDGEYEYTRYTVRAEKKFHINNLGRPSFSVEAGLINGQVPQHKLNSSLGTFKPNTFLIASENTFETMLPYEFFSSEYVHVHFRHSFGSLLLKIKKFQPEIIVTSSAGFGALSYEGFHGGETFNTMEKGYYESGLIMNKLINKLLGVNLSFYGVGVFYRYGPYKLPKESDNLTVKMTFSFTL